MVLEKLGRIAAVFLFLSGFLYGCQTTGFGEESEELELQPTAEPEPAEPETIELAERALADGRLKDAGLLLERYLFTYPKDPRGRIGAAELNLARRNTGVALEQFRRIVEPKKTTPASDEPALEKEGEDGESPSEASPVVTLPPELMARAQQGYGIAALLIGDKSTAHLQLTQALESDPSLWRAWNALGAYHDGERDWAASEIDYDNALRLQPQDPAILNNLGFSLLMQGRMAESAAALQTALRLEPGSALIETNLRLALAKQGDYRRATAGSNDDKELARALNNVGYVALVRGDYDEAEAYFQQAMQKDPSFNKTAWRNLNYLETLRSQDDTASGTAIVPAIN